jgi:hypothetical protein
MEPPSDRNEASGESKAERRLRKEAEKAAESVPLDSWERYRALNDLVDHMLDVIEMADRRTRFALLLLGSLNAANLLMVARGDMFGIALARQMGLANDGVVPAGALGLRSPRRLCSQRCTCAM